MQKGQDIESQNFKYRSQAIQNIETSKLQILIIGDAQTGKSQLSTLLTKRGFNQFLQFRTTDILNLNYKGIDKTIGCDIRVSMKDSSDKKYLLKLWDFSGDKNQRNYLDIYLSQLQNQINAVIFCFDCTNLKTLDNFRKWIKSLLTKKSIEQAKQNIQDEIDQGYSRQSSITVQEEQDSLLWFQGYTGFTLDQLMKIPFIFIGTKMDMIPYEKQLTVRSKSQKKIQKMFNNKNNDNLYLLSTKDIKQYHDEFTRLDAIFAKLNMVDQSNLDYLNLKTNPIPLLDLRLNDSFWKLNITGPIKKQLHLVKIYIKYCILSLTCKKSKK